MKNFLLVFALSGSCFFAKAQTYNNEWIDYSKTYYKFSVGATGLHRISQAALTAIGLNNTPAQNFQLWRQGVEIPLYTTVATGVLGTPDYIEFYGQINDGSQDTKLYKVDSLQMNNKWSMYTDSAAYFLTVNTATTNKRYANPGNNVAANVLPAEPYFMYTLSKYYKDALNAGYGVDLGELIHSSSYETAEGWGSNTLKSGISSTSKNTGLYVYAGGPAGSLTIKAAGNSSAFRTLTTRLNGNIVASGNISGYNIAKLTNNSIATSLLSGDTASISFLHNGSASDNIVLASYTLNYPRLFNFGNTTQFYFEIPAGPSKYIEVANFNAGTGIPILLDLTNNLRITGVQATGLVKFILPASAQIRKLVIFSTVPATIYAVNTFTTRNFVNYSQPANQGDYLMITHPNLFNDGQGNDNIEKYLQYRASLAGGGYNPKVILIDQLIDQFAYGIKHHPSSIRNFAAYALATFTSKPKFFYLIGKGISYYEFRKYERDRNINNQALVPTFGYPSSDNLLTSTRQGEYATIPLGRLSAINGTEVGIYLDKVKQFELAQKSSDQSFSGKGWMKNIAHITGGLTDVGLSSLIGYYMSVYQNISADSLYGANVYNFNKNSGSDNALGTTITLDKLFTEGLSVINYFGHSSPNSIEFNLDNPAEYNNTGKYPLIIINGCNSGNLFVFDTLRYISGGTLSEKFVLAPQKGSIAYIATTHYGLPTQLDYVNTSFYNHMSKDMYGQPLGNLMQATMQEVISNHNSDYLAQTHVEEINLHGDPALRMNPHTQPDYLIQDSLLTFSPSEISVADTKVNITARVINIGRAKSDSITIRVDHKYPDKSVITLGSYRIKAPYYQDSIAVTLNLNPAVDRGTHTIIVTVDPDNKIAELSELNNTTSKSFTIIEDEIRPVWPYEYAVVDNSNPTLFGSTANPLAASKQYVMEMDTTASFNSPLKITRTVTSTGGIIKFVPGATLTDSTVYYWRVALGPVTTATRWLKSSFVFINGGQEGFNQSHFYQYKNNGFNAMEIDSATHTFSYLDKTKRLLIRTGLYPYYNWDQININLDQDIVDYYGCVYNCLQFAVYDSSTLLPWKNYPVGNTGSYGSYPVCKPIGNGYRNIFEFPYDDTSYRRKAMDFLDAIPNGYYVSVTNLGYNGNKTFIGNWKSDTSWLGSGKSLWHKMHEYGLNKIDSFTKNLPFLFVFKKGDSLSFSVKQEMGTSVNVQVTGTYDIPVKDEGGSVTSPWMGPVNFWNNFKWDDKPGLNSTTQQHFEITGKNTAGNEVLLASVYNAKDTAIDFIDATVYPYLKMKMYSTDAEHGIASQLKNWMLVADNLPEGAVSPVAAFPFSDTLSQDDTLHFKVRFLNISNILFDSIKVKLRITDKEGAVHDYFNLPDGARLDQLMGGDSVLISFDIPLTDYFGACQLMLEVNPDNDQPEMFHFNNYIFKTLYVKNGALCPGSSPVFSINNTDTGNTYQWEVNTGGGYTSIIDGGLYGGTLSGDLQVKSVTTSMYGNSYRCRITNAGNVTYSPEYIVQFTARWTNAVNTAWNNAGNWSCNVVPDANTDVIISGGVPNYPVISNGVSASCRSLKALTGTSLTLNDGGKLDITGPPGK